MTAGIDAQLQAKHPPCSLPSLAPVSVCSLPLVAAVSACSHPPLAAVSVCSRPLVAAVSACSHPPLAAVSVCSRPLVAAVSVCSLPSLAPVSVCSHPPLAAVYECSILKCPETNFSFEVFVMSFPLKPFVLTMFALVMSALPAFSQQAFVQGIITDPDGKIVVGAIVTFENGETKNHIEAKTDKKGHYIQNMKAGMYSVTVTVDGKVQATMRQYEAVGGNGDPLDIKLKPLAQGGAQAAALAPAAGGGKEPAKGGSKEDDKAAKEREAQLAKNKELNDSFAAGKAAIDNKQWDEAITQLTKASELGPTQQAVWAALAEAYVGSAKAAKGADAGPIFDKSFAAFDKLLTITPDDAGTYNNYALALAADKRLDDAKVKLAKAVDLDPAGAGKYHYNLGALLMNSNQTDGAIEEFKKSFTADPNYAEAYFYYGSTLLGKATMDPTGTKMVAPPGTVEALQKYLQLKPDGPNAESAKQLIAALGSTIQANYKDPNAPATKSNKKTSK